MLYDVCSAIHQASNKTFVSVINEHRGQGMKYAKQQRHLENMCIPLQYNFSLLLFPFRSFSVSLLPSHEVPVSQLRC